MDRLFRSVLPFCFVFCFLSLPCVRVHTISVVLYRVFFELKYRLMHLSLRNGQNGWPVQVSCKKIQFFVRY